MTDALSAFRKSLCWLPAFAKLLYFAIGGLWDPGLRASTGKAPQAAAGPTRTGEWQSLFDGRSLQGWRETPFSGRGKVRVEDGTIILRTGALTGVTRTGPCA